jgi:TDG/mug DNA glycosylase family protein
MARSQQNRTPAPAADGVVKSRTIELPPDRRLTDCIRPGVRLLLVGINPGVRSATIGHHFAGYSNRFWRLLHESGLTPELFRAEDDVRLADLGFGVTNLIPRWTPGIDTLRPDEYVAGVKVLRRKIRRWRPQVVAFVGVTLFRAVFKPAPGAAAAGGRRAGAPITLGLQQELLEGARVFVLPNPSGRNANYSYAEMLAAFTALRMFLDTEGSA